MHRRTLLAGLAALPAFATPAAGGVGITDTISDPALPAIERYSAARTAVEAAPDDAAAEAELFSSYDALLRTPPTTIAGVQALAELAIEEDDMQIVEVLSVGLERLAAA